MNENGTEVPEQVLKFVPKEWPNSYGAQVEEVGQAIVAKIQWAADLSNENCDRAMALAHKLSMQLRAAEDRINQLEAEVELSRHRAVRTEYWLQTIQKRSRKSLSLRDQPTLPNKPRFPKTRSYSSVETSEE
jgi:hypothetical protein